MKTCGDICNKPTFPLLCITFFTARLHSIVNYENSGELIFLNVLVRQNPNASLETSAYRKQTRTDHIVNRHSYRPNSHNGSCLHADSVHSVKNMLQHNRPSNSIVGLSFQDFSTLRISEELHKKNHT